MARGACIFGSTVDELFKLRFFGDDSQAYPSTRRPRACDARGASRRFMKALVVPGMLAMT